MTKIIAFLIFVMYSSILPVVAQDYKPSLQKLPPHGVFTKLTPMKVNVIIDSHLGINCNNIAAAEKAGYYGVLEFGENFCQFSLYDKVGKEISKSLGSTDDKFIKDSSVKSTDHTRFRLVSLEKGNPKYKCYIDVYGCTDIPYCQQKIVFYQSYSENNQLKDCIWMEYDFKK